MLTMPHLFGNCADSFRDAVFYVLTSIAAILIYKWVKRTKKLPPGPYGLPFVGYSPFLGEDPSAKLNELSKKYGSIFSVRIGPNLMVILNDNAAMKEVLSNPNSLDRPPIFEFFQNMGFGKMNGDSWQEQRRATIQITKNLGIGKSHWEQSIRWEVSRVTDAIDSRLDTPTDIASELRKCIISMVVSLFIGRNLDPSEERLAMKCADIVFTEGSGSNIITQLPIVQKLLRYLPFSDFREKCNRIEDFENFFRKEISQRCRSEVDAKNDFIDLYLDMMKQINSSSKKNYFSENNLVGNVKAMFLAAIDTSHQTLLWLIHLMAKYPNIQKRVQEELDDAVGDSGVISYEERSKVPYTVSVIMETLRYSSIVPLSSTRSAVSDFEVRGYLIPKGTQISANLKAIHFDPNHWDDPKSFKPERFLKEDGIKSDSSPESYAPFSFGRRNCPGERIAWMEILLLFTTICHRYTISAPPGKEIRFDILPGLVTQLKQQPLCFSRRGVK